MRRLFLDAGVPVLVFFAMVVGIATAVAITVWSGPISRCSRAYFLTQVPILLTAALVSRAAMVGRESTLPGVSLG